MSKESKSKKREGEEEKKEGSKGGFEGGLLGEMQSSRAGAFECVEKRPTVGRCAGKIINNRSRKNPGSPKRAGTSADLRDAHEDNLRTPQQGQSTEFNCFWVIVENCPVCERTTNQTTPINITPEVNCIIYQRRKTISTMAGFEPARENPSR